MMSITYEEANRIVNYETTKIVECLCDGRVYWKNRSSVWSGYGISLAGFNYHQAGEVGRFQCTCGSCRFEVHDAN